jgi:hypothetical protein
VLLDILLTTNPGTFTVVPCFNGDFGSAHFVPEPGSIAVLAAGLLGPGLRRWCSRVSRLDG